jgi:hypothetical protein
MKKHLLIALMSILSSTQVVITKHNTSEKNTVHKMNLSMIHLINTIKKHIKPNTSQFHNKAQFFMRPNGIEEFISQGHVQQQRFQNH